MGNCCDNPGQSATKKNKNNKPNPYANAYRSSPNKKPTQSFGTPSLLRRRDTTRLALVRRKINIPDTKCPLCDTDEETAEHIMVRCGFVFGVWSKIWNWCRISGWYPSSVDELLRLHHVSHKSKGERRLIRGIMMITCWSIWIERNNKVFQGGTPRVVEVVARIKALSFIWLKHRSRFKNFVWNDWVIYPLYSL